MLPCCRLVHLSTRCTIEMRRYMSTSTFLLAAFAIQTTKNADAAWAGASSPSYLHRRPHLVPLAHNQRFMSSSSIEGMEIPNFRRGDSIQVEVVSFGPLGASVDVVGIGHPPDSVIAETEPPLGQGLVLQREIHYFRQARNNVDVIKGEVLPAYVEKVREDGRMDICLRKPGGKAKAEDVGKLILERLEWNPTGRLQVGDKSSPEDISKEFPGVSKGAFKKAVAALYKKGLVQPGPGSIELIKKDM